MSEVLEGFVRECRARIHAFCLAPADSRLIVEASDVPLQALISRITPSRYSFVLLHEKHCLLECVRHIHLLPAEAGLAADPAMHPTSSHRAYLGLEHIPWLSMRTVFAEFRSAGRELSAYRLFMAGRQASSDAEFLSWLRRESVLGPRLATANEIIVAVCAKLHVDPAEIMTKSHRRDLTLARGLITWHLVHGRIASVSQAARILHRDPSTLYTAVERCRKTHPWLFNEALGTLVDQARDGLRTWAVSSPHGQEGSCRPETPPPLPAPHVPSSD
jgi:hypothetical protein